MTSKAAFSITNPVHFLALGFGSGLLKPAPGTWGTLSALPIYYMIVSWFELSLTSYIVLAVVMFAVGIYLCGKTADDVGVPDHSAIVWDEIVGFLITMVAIAPTAVNVLLGFLLFRLFDILKPWPIRVIDRQVHGGFGIMVDDVIAGLAACAILHFLQPFIS